MYVMLSNIYGQNKRFVKANEIRNYMKKQNVMQKPGKTYTFMANDKSNEINNEKMDK